MFKPLALAVALLVPAAALACEHAEGEACNHEKHEKHQKAAAEKKKESTLHRGEAFKGAPAAKLAEVLSAPETFAGKTVTVEGTVRKACTNKGCWMELADGGEAKSAAVRVTFKNYGFFVPLDSAGSVAKVEGELKVAELSEAKAKHWEGEGATVPRGKDGKPREVQLVATAVELRR